MPKYQYRCEDCSDEFEQFQKFSEDALTECPSCQGFIRRVIGPVGVVFKGSGWYITDSRPSSENGKPADKPKKDDTAPVAKSDSPSDSTAKPAATETTKAEKPKPVATATVS